MKKKISVLLAVGLLAGLLCGTAQAADILESGFYNIGTEAADVTVTPLDESGKAVSSTQTDVDDDTSTTETFYPGSVKLTVELTGAASGSEYVVLLVSGTALPTSESDIYYIDQITAGDTGSVSFNVYPMEITGLTDLKLFITSDQESFTTRFVSLHYASAYTLGDVNDDGSINVNDAMAVINHIVSKSTLSGANLLAADVTGDGLVNVNDAMEIINYIVGKPQYLGK